MVTDQKRARADFRERLGLQFDPAVGVLNCFVWIRQFEFID
jgi:hypothetical protein